MKIGREFVDSYSSPNNSLKSSTKLIRTTMADPARPAKNIHSRNFIAMVAKIMSRIYPLFRKEFLKPRPPESHILQFCWVHSRKALTRPNALNSTLYALAFNEDVGCGRSLCRAAGIAVPARRPHAALARHLRVVRSRPAALGDSWPGHRRASTPLSSGVSAFLPLRRPVVHGQLLLDPRHDDALRRHAHRSSHASAHRIQSGSRPLLRPLRSGHHAGSPGNGQNQLRPHRRTLPLGRARPRCRPRHQRAVGSTWLFAS